MKLPFRPLPVLISLAVVAALYWGLSQAESRSIYAPWDKWLHACVFFVIWWLGRWSLKLGSFWVTVLVVLSGGAEEIHQLFQDGHVADLGDWLADIAGVSVALAIYVVGRLLWLLRESVEDARDSAHSQPLSLQAERSNSGSTLTPLDCHGLRPRNDEKFEGPRDGEKFEGPGNDEVVEGPGTDSPPAVIASEAKQSSAPQPEQGEPPRHRHALDWRWNLKLWRWEYYVVLLAGHERRSLSRREQEIARWSVGFLIFVFLLVSTGIGLLVMYLIKVALGV